MNTAQAINSEIRVDDWVVAIPKSGFDCLAGVVTAIDKHGSPDHVTNNPGDDVHVNFIIGGYSEHRMEAIAHDYSWQYTEDKSFDELPLDDVILAPNSLIRVTDLSPDEFKAILDDSNIAEAYCNTVIANMDSPPPADPIQAEARRIADEFQKLTEPNSPNKTHYMVQVSPEFIQNASSEDMNRLFKAIPIKGLSFSTLKGEKGIFAFTSKDAGHKRQQKKQKTSVLGRLEDKSKQAEGQPSPETKPPRKRGAI